MAFQLPPFEVITDSDGHLCLRTDDALAIAQALSSDPTQPFHFNSNCGHRAQLMIGRLISDGFPSVLIHRVQSHATEPRNDGTIPYTRRNPLGATFQKLVGDIPDMYPAERDIPGSNLKVHFLDAQEVYIHDKVNPRGNHYVSPGYEEFEPGFALHFDGESQTRIEEHHTIGLPILNEQTGKSEIKIIDPHFTNPIKLLSFVEWKEMLNCDDAVILSGPVGKPLNIVVEDGCLRASEINKLGTLIKKHLPDAEPAHLNDVKTALLALDNHTADSVTATLLNTDNDRIRYIEPDWDTRTATERKEFINYLVSTLEPLVEIEDKWQEKFTRS